jgi:hypothetical protein
VTAGRRFFLRPAPRPDTYRECPTNPAATIHTASGTLRSLFAARNGADGGGCYPAYKRANPVMIRGPPEPRRRYDDEQIAGQENPGGGKGRTNWPGDKISDKTDRYDNGAGCDHCHRHGIEKLLVSEPGKLIDHSPVQEGDNGQATSKYKSSSLRKVLPEQRSACGGTSGTVQAREPPDRN